METKSSALWKQISGIKYNIQKLLKKKLIYKITLRMNNIHDIHDIQKTKMNSEKYDINANPYIEDPWTIIESYFRGQHLDRLVRHQLESYNNFVG